MDISLAVEYFAIASVYLAGKSEVSTQRLDGLCTTCNTLETAFEVGGKLNPVICRNTEPLQNRWGGCAYSATFTISDNSASPVDQLNGEGDMQLVDRRVHELFQHSGGISDIHDLQNTN